MRQPPDLSGHITVADKACFPAFSGGYGDIWLGIWQKKSKETCQVSLYSERNGEDPPDC